jgi:outer membrane protein OmpA-like peptidoglycan-associated protein
MKKLTTCFIAALSVINLSTLNAQTASKSENKFKVETNRFFDNWFISVGGGAQVYFGDNDNKADFGKRIAPALDIAVGKWFTPGLGLRLEYSGLQAKGLGTMNAAYTEGVANNKGLYKQDWNMMHLHGDVLFNLTDIFCGYREGRVYSAIPYVGLGWMHSYDRPKTNELAATVGFINRFRLSSALDLNLEMRGTLVNDRFDGEIGGNGKEGLAAVTLGLTYKFKQRGFQKATVRTVSTGISESDMQQLRDRLNNMQREKQRLADELEAARNKKAETIVSKELAIAPRIILFPLGKSTLSKQERVNLGYFAKLIKEGPADKVYTIVGYADNKTGSAAVNERLSKERAEAVRDALVSEFGVKASQLKTESKGGVDNMYYNDETLSRAVIVE